MKAIIIENEYDIPRFLRGFLKDNPDLFESVDEQIGCINRSMEEMTPYILDADAVLAESTWMYIDQLEDFTDIFASGKLGKDYKFYIKWFTGSLNKWIGEDDYTNFTNRGKFISQIKALIKKKLIYTIQPDYDSKESITDYFHDWPDGSVKKERHLHRAYLIKYSKKHDIFYNENETVKHALKHR